MDLGVISDNWFSKDGTWPFIDRGCSFRMGPGGQHGQSICFHFLNNQQVSLQAQLAWLIDREDSQNEQLDHLTIWFLHHVLTQSKLHMLQYLQSCHCYKTLTRHLLLTGALGEFIKIRNQLTLACLSFANSLMWGEGSSYLHTLTHTHTAVTTMTTQRFLRILFDVINWAVTGQMKADREPPLILCVRVCVFCLVLWISICLYF